MTPPRLVLANLGAESGDALRESRGGRREGELQSVDLIGNFGGRVREGVDVLGGEILD